MAFVNQFEDGQSIEQVLVVRQCDRRRKRDGGEFLKITLGDKTGGIAAMIWDDVEKQLELTKPGSVVFVSGRFSVHPKFGAQINLFELREALDSEYEIGDLLDGPPRNADLMETDLRSLVATVQEPHLRILLETIFEPGSSSWQTFRDAPAAKRYHQAYRHGLLEHCLTVAEGVSAVSATFPGIDRDVAVAGALLHDIGKLEAYTNDVLAIDLTDAGRLQGEIPLGYYRIRRLIEEIDAFPAELAQSLLHIILSHHGSLEHGSPVVPATREATLVHMIDNLGGKLGSFDRLEKELGIGERWSGFDQAIGGGAFFSERAA